MSRLERWEPWLKGVFVVLTAFLVLGAAMDGRWGWVALVVGWLLALGALPVHGRRKAAQRAASVEAAPDWTPERVADVLAGCGGRHVAAVKAVREQDPRLSLQEADQLVRGVSRR